jgi:hypothetical protein
VNWRAVREQMRARATLGRVEQRLRHEVYLKHPDVNAFVKEA